MCFKPPGVQFVLRNPPLPSSCLESFKAISIRQVISLMSVSYWVLALIKIVAEYASIQKDEENLA